jgi:predicted nucleotidyltransferase
VVTGPSFLDELRPIARRCITGHHYHHYRGFFATQRKLLEKQSPKTYKAVLYAYRVLLSGIHLLRTGEVEAFLPRLAETYRQSFVAELIARKREEKGPARDLDWSFHDARLRQLEAELERAFAESTLPEERDRQTVHQFLVEHRLSNSSSEGGSNC